MRSRHWNFFFLKKSLLFEVKWWYPGIPMWKCKHFQKKWRHLSTRCRIVAGGESGVNLAFWRRYWLSLIQAGPNSVLGSIRMGNPLRNNMDCIELPQEQPFFSERALPPEGLFPRTMECHVTLLCNQQVAAYIWILLSTRWIVLSIKPYFANI